MSTRFIVGMLAFNEYEMAIGALEAFRRNKTLDCEQYLFDVGFPGTNEDEWRRIATQFGFQYMKMENRGVAGNWNQMILLTMAGAEDILFGLDPDEYISSKARHWMFSMIQAFNKLPDAGYIGFNRPKFDDAYPAKELIDLGDVRVYKYPQLISWQLGAFHGRFFSKFPIEQRNPQYGFIEHSCWARMQHIGQTFYMLKDYYSYHKESVYKLSVWKKECARGETSLPYEQWLKYYVKKC